MMLQFLRGKRKKKPAARGVLPGAPEDGEAGDIDLASTPASPEPTVAVAVAAPAARPEKSLRQRNRERKEREEAEEERRKREEAADRAHEVLTKVARGELPPIDLQERARLVKERGERVKVNGEWVDPKVHAREHRLQKMRQPANK